ncbi:MAG TPA: suppressor of fused domain protein [Gemmata sp.]
MAAPDPNAIVQQHLRRFFAGHACREHVWPLGPAATELPRLRVLEFAPGPRNPQWVYATAGGWEARADPRLEFLIVAPEPDLRHVELLFITAWYHGRRELGRDHTVPLGGPWLPGSACEFFLVSRPYPFGPELEVCNLPDGHLHVLWLLPITLAEREFKILKGAEALEQRFDECGLEFWVPGRPPAV